MDTHLPPATEKPDTIERLLAHQLKRLRARSNLTLRQLSAKSRISTSTLSKIENGLLSPTYEKIASLAHALDVDVGELFKIDTDLPPVGRRSICRKNQGIPHLTRQYEYELLCADLTQKRFIPLLATIKAHSLKEFPKLLQHSGEEFIYVLLGNVTVHTSFYAPLDLGPGDSCYFDSTMGHACVSSGEHDAQVLWICSNTLS